jgi:hypothetical protein
MKGKNLADHAYFVLNKNKKSKRKNKERERGCLVVKDFLDCVVFDFVR